MSEIRVDTISEKTSANGVAVDGVTLKDGKVGIGTAPSTDLHIKSTADNAPHLLLENFQNADTDDAPVIELYLNDQTTGGIGDNTDVGVIRFTGDEKDGGSKETYAEIRGVAHDPGQGTGNRGHLSLFVQSAGSLAETMTLDESQVGIGETTPLGTLHVRTADTGASASNDANELILEQNGASGLTILSANNSQGNIFFGDDGDNDVGRIIYNHSNNNMSFRSNATEFLRADEDGHVIMPKQPAFLASPASQQSNLANNTTLLFGTEITDRNADFNAGNGTFTAPVTGLYQVGFSIRLQEVPINATYVMVETVTSNRSFFYILDPGVFDEDAAYWEFNGNYLIDMDANDTYFIRYIQSGGNTSTDMSTTSYSFGTLAC